MGIKKGTLTIGNYIHSNPNGIPAVKTVIETREQDIVCNSINNPDQRLALWYSCAYLEPIYITPAWLRNLGFKESVKGEWFTPLPDYSTAILALKQPLCIANGYTAKFVYLDGAFILPNQIYVHQLQNLYASFAPGRFLTIKK